MIKAVYKESQSNAAWICSSAHASSVESTSRHLDHSLFLQLLFCPSPSSWEKFHTVWVLLIPYSSVDTLSDGFLLSQYLSIDSITFPFTLDSQFKHKCHQRFQIWTINSHRAKTDVWAMIPGSSPYRILMDCATLGRRRRRRSFKPVLEARSS